MAIDHVRRHLGRLGQAAAGVSLEVRPADTFEGRPAEGFDLVVLNSVVQYFPDAAYLRRVLAGALDCLAPGGRVFLGDVRSLPLLPTLTAAVWLHRAAPGQELATVRAAAWRAAAWDDELVVAPQFFTALAAELPGVAGCRCC